MRPLADLIFQQLEELREFPESPIYIVEMADRWLVYYLKKLGLTILRLSPERRDQLILSGDNPVILLNATEEAWRLELLKDFRVSYSEKRDSLPSGDSLALIQVPSNALKHWELKKAFPTNVSKPPSWLCDKLKQTNLVAFKQNCNIG